MEASDDLLLEDHPDGRFINGTPEEEAAGGHHHHQWDLSPSQTAVSFSAMVAFYLVSQAANLGIWYYERVVPDTHRTLLNKLAAVASLYKAGMGTVFFPVIAVRLLMPRGLPGAACHLQWCLFMFGLIQLMLCYNEMVALQYIYMSASWAPSA